MLSSSASIQNVQPFDKNVEMCLYVTQFQAVREVKGGNQMAKIMASNGEGLEIQIVAWNSAASSLSSIGIAINSVIHFENGYAKPFTDERFRRGSVGFEIHLNKDALIEVVATHPPSPPAAAIPIFSKALKDVEVVDQVFGEYIEITDLFVKSLPRSAEGATGSTKVLCAFTDKDLKLDAELQGFESFSSGIKKAIQSKFAGS